MINVVFVLDETGSMQIRKDETVKQFNKYIKKIKKHKNADDVRFSLTRFNSSKRDIFYDKVKLKNVKKLTDYTPDFATPLYDAIGLTINSIKSDKCIFVILTDGEENSSIEFTYDDIVKLVKDKTDDGWEFVFLATGLDNMQARMVVMAVADMGFGTQKSSHKVRQLYNTAYINTVAYLDDEDSTAKSTE
jgi:hypothetical protein